MKKPRDKRPRAERILEALDLLAAALVNHAHQWTEEERSAYEFASASMQKDLDMFRRAHDIKPPLDEPLKEAASG